MFVVLTKAWTSPVNIAWCIRKTVGWCMIRMKPDFRMLQFPEVLTVFHLWIVEQVFARLYYTCRYSYLLHHFHDLFGRVFVSPFSYQFIELIFILFSIFECSKFGMLGPFRIPDNIAERCPLSVS